MAEQIPVGQESGRGWRKESMRHGLAAKGIKTGDKKIWELQGPSREQFQKIAKAWKEGKPIPYSTEQYIPTERIWLEGADRAEQGENIQYAYKVRPSVYRKAAFKAGGMPAYARSYVPSKYRPKKPKSERLGKAKQRAEFKRIFE